MSQEQVKKLIFEKLKAGGLNDQNARYWVAVSAHETGGWKSPVYRENNNLFGMRHPSRRATLSRGSSLGHARFDSLEDSVADLLLYFKGLNWKQLNFATSDELVEYMKLKAYFEADLGLYKTAVRNWLRRI